MNFGDIVILFMIGVGMAGLAGLAVYEYFEKRDDRENESRNGTTDYWSTASSAQSGTSQAEVSDRDKPWGFPEEDRRAG